jgi:hypothetical protein
MRMPGDLLFGHASILKRDNTERRHSFNHVNGIKMIILQSSDQSIIGVIDLY